MVWILENVRHLARRLGRPHLRAVLAFDRHAARGRLEQTDDLLGQSGFAGAVLPDYRDEVGGFDSEIDRIEHARPARIAEAHILDCHKCGADRGVLGSRRGFGCAGTGEVANRSCGQTRVNPYDRVVSLLDAFRLCVDSEQFECVAQSGRTHAAFHEQVGAREHLGRRTVGGDFPLAQYHYPIGGAQFLGLVLDYDQAQALRAQPGYQLEDFRPALGIEIGGRLVEHYNRRPQRQHRRDRKALLLAARQRHRIAMLKAAQPDGLQRGNDSPIHLRAVHADLFHCERDFVRDVGRKQLRLEILEDHAHFRRDVADAKMLERLACNTDRAAKIAVLELRDDAIEAFRERGLARARRAHHADHLTGGLHEADRSKGRTVGAVVGERDSLDPNCVRAGSR